VTVLSERNFETSVFINSGEFHRVCW